jgi:cell division protein FtsZ
MSNSPIKVIGVGGGGSNAVNTMYERGIQGVDFIVCNTDAQALQASQVECKIQLGATLTEGQGAGSQPEVGRNAAIESIDEIKELLNQGTRMVFVTAGMGGGTGTGAAPIIAKAAKDLGILTVGIVTIPFKFEGRRRENQANQGLEEMRNSVDTLLIIRNDKLRELYSGLTIREAFTNADEVLCTAAKGIAEVITLTGEINVDMNDVNTVMRESGRAIMGAGKASGEGRAEKAVREALESPLLNDHDITGARFVLLNITFSKDEILLDEAMEITDIIQEAAGQTAEVIWGYGIDENLSEDISVTVIATGFHALDGEEPAAATKLWLGSGMPPKSEAEPTQAVQETKSLTAQTWNAPLNRSTMEEKPQPPITQPDVLDTTQWEVKEIPSTPEPEATPTLFTAPEPETEDNMTIRYTLEMEDAFETETPQEATPTEATESTNEANRFIIHNVGNEAPAQQPQGQNATTDTQARHAERNRRLAMLNRPIKSPSELKALEDEPAYRRRQVQLDEVPPSNARTISNFTLRTEEDEDGNSFTSFSPNGFLSDQVD